LHFNKSTGLDYSTILKLLPPSSPEINEIERLLKHLKPRTEAAQKQETAEMLGKLKGLGNTILGAPTSNPFRGELTWLVYQETLGCPQTTSSLNPMDREATQ
jgi:hypothetical protein